MSQINFHFPQFIEQISFQLSLKLLVKLQLQEFHILLIFLKMDHPRLFTISFIAQFLKYLTTENFQIIILIQILQNFQNHHLKPFLFFVLIILQKINQLIAFFLYLLLSFLLLLTQEFFRIQHFVTQNLQILLLLKILQINQPLPLRQEV